MTDWDGGKTPQRVLVAGVCGSLRAGSYTAAALRIALQGAQEFGAQISFVDLNDYDLGLHLGHVDTCRDRPGVRRFRAELKAADG